MKNTSKEQLYFITLLLVIFLLPAAVTAESIWISSPSDGATFDDETITLYAQVSNSSMSVPFIKYSHDPSEAPPMTYWGNNIYIYNVNFSVFPDGPGSILVSSGEYTDSINITKESITVTPTPTPTPEPLKNLYIKGIKDGESYDNSSLFFIVYDNETMDPINQPDWFLWHQNRIENTGTGYYSGRCNIEWVNDMAEPLDDGAYLIQVKSKGYEPAEFLVKLVSPAPPTITDKSISVFGLDKQVADDVTTWIYVMDGSDVYIEDVCVKVLDREGTTITSQNTDVNGRVLINWQEITVLPAGEHAFFAVEFTKPGFKRKVVDITVVSSMPTPSPTPTPTPEPTITPTPAPTPTPTTTTRSSNPSVPATTSNTENKDSSKTSNFMILISGIMGAGLCLAVVFPDKTKGIRDGVMSTLKENSRRVSNQGGLECRATYKDPISGIENKCKGPVVPGTHYCSHHQGTTIVRQAFPDDNMNVKDNTPMQNMAGHSVAETEGDDLVVELPAYDDRLMNPEALERALQMVIGGFSDDDIKVEIEKQFGAAPNDDWMEEIHVESENRIDQQG